MQLIITLLCFLCCTISAAQDKGQCTTDSAAMRALVVGYALPQERVYLHFDNTVYYLGETIWFKAFVTSHGDDGPTVLSRVLYVELMSPEGYVIKTEKYRIDDNGTCDGGIYLDPNYLSGFFEIRAYTRYMLNWGDESIFSRVFPVYDKVNNGDWEFRNIRDRSQGFFANKVFKKKVEPELRFYPESGHLVDGIESCIAYELTGFEGIDLYDEITVLANGRPLLKTRPEHMGKGRFTLTPRLDTEYTAKVNITNDKGKKKVYEFELPGVEHKGCVLSVTENGDSIDIGIRCNVEESCAIGFAILHRNRMGFYKKVSLDTLALSINKNDLNEGVNRAILFKGKRPLAERLFFVEHDSLKAGDRQTVKLRVTGNGKIMYKLEAEPHGKVSLLIEREDGKPIDGQAEFALSVNDQSGRQTTSWGYNLYTYMLLGSELKGYIPDAWQYFDSENPNRKPHLDLVMLTNGWTAYDWSELTAESLGGIVPPEEGITVKGDLVLRVRSRKFGQLGSYNVNAQPYIPVRIDFTANDSTIKTQAFRTDSAGKFCIILDDFAGKQTVALSPETYLKHSHRINYAFYMDKYFSPKPHRFCFWQLNVGSSIRRAEDTTSQGMQKIGINEYMFGNLDVTTKKRRRYTETAPISELRLDYLEEWEYAMDVGLGRIDGIYKRIHDYDVPDAQYVSDGDLEAESSGVELPDKEKGNTESFNVDWHVGAGVVWSEFAIKQHNVLSVADVLSSIYARYDLGLQNWVYPVVIKGEYNSDSIPVADKEYTHGVNVEAMTNFKEVILTSNPKNLETVTEGNVERWKFRAEHVLPGKHPHERFYYGFLTQLPIRYTPGASSRIYDSELNYDLELATRNITGRDRKSMVHPNNIAYLIPDRRDNKSLIRNDLSISSSTRRYTSVQGYTAAKQFYSPDYSTMTPDEKDYRRTLLWNPSVKAVDGKLQIDFYNSSTCSTIAVDVLGYHNNTVYSNSEDIRTKEGCCMKQNRRVRTKKSNTLQQDSIFWAQCQHEFENAEVYYNKNNYKKALTIYIELAQYNFPAAFYKIGEFYLKGINLKKKYDLAAQFFERGAELGVADCYYELSQMHRHGMHYDADRANEIKLMEIAAELNEPRAQLQLGRYLLDGEYVEKDTLRATELLRECALTSNPEAMYEYAILMMASGIDNDSVFGTPLRCMESAASNNSGNAMMWMIEYEKNNGNLERAYSYAKELHILGDHRGTKFMADCYREGKGVKRDKRLAKDLYREAEAAGNEEAKKVLKEW